ncbi:redox-sensing transcriptional repressor Rex [Acetanaerobacterium elongatum]|uniref:Redox-sensing transcriptional repressor Rex n=1 Tax=Acetanaerobacterium elongatum TaxID=258515 RepID=A0A1H0AZJ1_9FIRM|nr:redox-sensing transcriptional repressor Rex [Acetanaerobacterium elongatum]SDN38751.1 redox-sensing transcriptional repressor [Acetanaerobacterium elongatum]
MAKSQSVSLSVIRRLPRYYRFLSDLKAAGILRISSRELSSRMGLTASQIRQDLNCFGGFGQQGYGYNVEQLHAEIGNILGVGKKHKTILLGAGNLGKAVAAHMDFEAKGFDLIGVFETDKQMIGKNLRGLKILSSEMLVPFCKEHQPLVAILCIPKDSARKASDLLVELGIKAFWNFTHYDFAVSHPGIVVENVHLGDSLMILSYRVNETLEGNSTDNKE